jgi:hypothetical protein
MKRAIVSYVFALGAPGLIVNASALAENYTIGGAVYSDLSAPLTSGMVGVVVCVQCEGGFFGCDVAQGSWGGWDISAVPADSCTVAASADGLCFNHVSEGEIGSPGSLAIVVDAAHLGENLSIQFLGTTGANYCCVATEDCDDGEACTVDACSEGVCANTLNECPQDFDCDGFVNAADLAVLLGSWGLCPECEADLDDDGDVDASDLAIVLGTWGSCT